MTSRKDDQVSCTGMQCVMFTISWVVLTPSRGCSVHYSLHMKLMGCPLGYSEDKTTANMARLPGTKSHNWLQLRRRSKWNLPPAFIAPVQVQVYNRSMQVLRLNGLSQKQRFQELFSTYCKCNNYN